MSRERTPTRYSGVYHYPTDKGKRYGATAEMRRDWRSGKRRTLRKEGFLTEREARAWRDATLSERDGPVYDGATMTLGAFWTRWLELKRRDVKPGSMVFYERYLGWAGELAGVPLAEVTPLAIGDQIQTLLGRGYGAYSVRNWLTCLRSVLKAAVDAEVIARNPASRVKGPAGPPRTTPIWTADELRRFLAASSEDGRWGIIFRFMAESWCRVGEMSGLEWRDVDFEAGAVTIQRTWHVQHGLTTPKSGRARTIPLSAGLMEALRQHRDRRRFACEVRGVPWGPETPVFVTQYGNRIQEGTANTMLRVWCARAGVPQIPPHGIRHTGATIAFHSGLIDIVTLSKRLGHASVTITMAVYVKGDDIAQRRAADDFASLLDVG